MKCPHCGGQLPKRKSTRRAFASSGGKARAAKLSSYQRIEIAKKAAKARWAAQIAKRNA